MRISTQRAAYLAAARADVGYLEKKTADPRYLADKKANAGRNNFTKYGEWYGNNGAPWCMQAQSFWAIHKALIPTTIIPKSQSCSWTVAWATKRGRYHTRRSGYDPQPGDQVILKGSNGKIAHVGLVYRTEDWRIFTVEGNTSAGDDEVIPNGGAAAEKSYSKTSTSIHGYFNPDYDFVEVNGFMDILQKVKEQAKATDEDLASVLIGLLQNRQAGPVPKWKTDGAAYLKDTGLNGVLHDGNETVEFGELGAILQNHLKKHHDQ